MPLASKLNFVWPILSALSPRRHKQLLLLQLLNILAGLGEIANIGALLPFLRLLANPMEGIRSLGPLAEPLRGFSSLHLLLILGITFMVVVAVSTALRLLAIYVQLRLGALISSDLGEQVYKKILARPYSWHLENTTSAVLTYLTNDVELVYGSLQALMLLIMNLFIVVLLGSFLIVLAPATMLTVAIALASVYILIFIFTSSSLRSDGARQTLGFQRTIQIVQEGIGGIRDVIIDNTQAYFVQLYRQSNQSQKMAGASIQIKLQFPRFLIEGSFMLLIVGVSMSLSMSGQGIEKQLPILGTLTLGAYRILQPLQLCFASLSTLNSSKVSIQRLEPFLKEINSLVYCPSNPSPYLKSNPSVAELVKFDKVSFRYNQNSPWVLQNLSLTINKGERIAFVGSTGSGKSTTTDLLLGLLAPTEGKVLIQDHDLQYSTQLLRQWQSQVAHVPQQIYLVDASLAANIAFGVPFDQIDYDRVKLAAKQARIDEFIQESSGGYETRVGEHGVLLSGGQRQRIGIARALYKRSKLLVLDEATSALDNRTEAEVMAAIEGLDSSLTVVLIAHRLSTIRNCHRIVMLGNGQIEGIGSFDELISGNVRFQALASSIPSSSNS